MKSEMITSSSEKPDFEFNFVFSFKAVCEMVTRIHYI